MTNFAWDSNTNNQAWNIGLNADGLLSISNTTYGVGTSSIITPGSESGPPECGTKLPLENYLLSPTHSLPNLCSSNGNISQVLTTNDETTTIRNINSSANTDFVFESRGVPIQPNKTPISSQRKPRDSSALKCDFPGCHSRATFKRKYELQRHMKKHERKETYPCPAIDCDRKGSRSFYRADKFAHHFGTRHGDNDTYLCPLAKCLTNQMSLDEIKLHARSHESRCNSVVEIVQRIPATQRQCMLKNCLKRVDILGMQSHLLGHTVNERKGEAAVIQQMGYDAETVKVICPLCKLLLHNHGEFAAHLQSAHLTTDSVHLAEFRESVANIIILPFPEYPIWNSWSAQPPYWQTMQSMVCPTCGQPASTQRPAVWIDHHVQLLLDQNEVRPYRRDILRLCPGFSTHPVFNDIRAVVFERGYPSN